ncbi:hypothetical protein N7G274_003334 [Stereocaulon virgatum]|uniref:Uncharacterized protein n=1 Tax=Stereocaulon virgatum TaxID=373712 RepID=A0ABR4ADB6_9LECA
MESRDSPASIPVPGAAFTNKTPKTEAAQSTVNVYVCIDVNFCGDCQNLASTPNPRYNLGNGVDDSISSLGSSMGVDCNFYNCGTHIASVHFNKDLSLLC